MSGLLSRNGLVAASAVIAAIITASLASALGPKSFQPGDVLDAKTMTDLWAATTANEESVKLIAALDAKIKVLEAKAATPGQGGVPPGSVITWAAPCAAGKGAADGGPPEGWLCCDGAEYGQFDAPFSLLYKAIGTSHGAGTKALSFNVPDYRGRFLRGIDGGTGRDPDVAARLEMQPGGKKGPDVGSIQASATQMPKVPFAVQEGGAHSHALPFEPNGCNVVTQIQEHKYKGTVFQPGGNTSGTPAHGHGLAGGDKETRPANAYVNWIIKL